MRSQWHWYLTFAILLLSVAFVCCDVVPLDLAGYPCESDADCAGLKCHLAGGSAGVCHASDWKPSADGIPDSAEVSVPERDDIDRVADDVVDDASTDKAVCEEGVVQACQSSKPGLCAVGSQRCRSGQWETCQPSSKPKAEVCDGLDNDCDGQIDNDPKCPRYTLAGSPSGISMSSSIMTDEKGNVYALGSFQTSVRFGDIVLNARTKRDGFVVKIDDKGAIQWVKQLSFARNDAGSSSEDRFQSAVYANGAVYVGGGSFGDRPTKDFNFRTKGYMDGFLLKLDAKTGSVLWLHRMGGVNGDSVSAVVADKEGNIYVNGSYGGTVDFGVGGHRCTSAGELDLFVVKISPDRRVLWATCFGGKRWDAMKADIAAKGLTTAKGSVYALGYLSGQSPGLAINIGPTTHTLEGIAGIMVKLDASTGKIQWSYELCATAVNIRNGPFCHPFHIVADERGDLVVTGAFSGGVTLFGAPQQGGTKDHFVASFTPKQDGSMQHHWTHLFRRASIYDIALNPKSGTVYATGFYERDATINGAKRIDGAQLHAIGYIVDIDRKSGDVGKDWLLVGDGAWEGRALAMGRDGRFFLSTNSNGPNVTFKRKESISYDIKLSGSVGALWNIPLP